MVETKENIVETKKNLVQYNEETPRIAVFICQ